MPVFPITYTPTLDPYGVVQGVGGAPMAPWCRQWRRLRRVCTVRFLWVVDLPFLTDWGYCWGSPWHHGSAAHSFHHHIWVLCESVCDGKHWHCLLELYLTEKKVTNSLKWVLIIKNENKYHFSCIRQSDAQVGVHKLSHAKSLEKASHHL